MNPDDRHRGDDHQDGAENENRRAAGADAEVLLDRLPLVTDGVLVLRPGADLGQVLGTLTLLPRTPMPPSASAPVLEGVVVVG